MYLEDIMKKKKSNKQEIFYLISILANLFGIILFCSIIYMFNADVPGEEFARAFIYFPPIDLVLHAIGTIFCFLPVKEKVEDKKEKDVNEQANPDYIINEDGSYEYKNGSENNPISKHTNLKSVVKILTIIGWIVLALQIICSAIFYIIIFI